MIDQCGTLLLSAQRFRHNVSFFRSAVSPRTGISAVVKANAYGHGIEPMLQLLRQENIQWCSVFTMAEAIVVHRLSPDLNIHIMAPMVFSSHDSPPPEADFFFGPSSKAHLTMTDRQSAEYLNQMAARLGQMVMVQIQLDVGLTRQGCDTAEFDALVAFVRSASHLKLTGLFAHFSHGEVPSSAHTAMQLDAFLRATDKHRSDAILIHVHNTGSTVRCAHPEVDLVRIGIGLYGLEPGSDHPLGTLQPIASLVAPVLAVHDRPIGTGIGYGHQFITARPSRIAILPVGYADGYRRELGNRAMVEFGDAQLPVIGRVSMDQIAVDATGTSLRTGDCVTLISSDPTSVCSMDNLASRCGTIGYEIATGLGPRLKRRFL